MASVIVPILSAAVRNHGRGGTALSRRLRQTRTGLAIRDLRYPGGTGLPLRAQPGTLLRRAAPSHPADRQPLAARFECDRRLRAAAAGLGLSARRASARR